MSGRDRVNLEELIDFPCDYLFKAFGPAEPEGRFVAEVRDAVEETVTVPLDAIKVRRSSRGSYVAVSVLVRLHNARQIMDIYTSLRKLENLKYLL